MNVIIDFLSRFAIQRAMNVNCSVSRGRGVGYDADARRMRRASLNCRYPSGARTVLAMCLALKVCPARGIEAAVSRRTTAFCSVAEGADDMTRGCKLVATSVTIEWVSVSCPSGEGPDTTLEAGWKGNFAHVDASELARDEGNCRSTDEDCRAVRSVYLHQAFPGHYALDGNKGLNSTSL